MSDKYIIKNCEQIHSSDNFCWSKSMFCQDCTDCVMKQIVELCTDAKKYGESFIRIDDILDVLDIQEVE